MVNKTLWSDCYTLWGTLITPETHNHLWGIFCHECIATFSQYNETVPDCDGMILYSLVFGHACFVVKVNSLILKNMSWTISELLGHKGLGVRYICQNADKLEMPWDTVGFQSLCLSGCMDKHLIEDLWQPERSCSAKKKNGFLPGYVHRAVPHTHRRQKSLCLFTEIW